MNGQPGTVYPDSSFDVPGVPVVPGTNTLTATYVGPAYTNAPMTATDTSTIVLGDTVYTHDSNGNLTSDATFTYQYDLANQLTNVIRKSDSVSVLQCRYDALSRRVEAIRADGTVDRYVYFPGSFLVLAVLDETNAPKELYTRGPDLSGTLSSAGGIGGILACTYASGPVLYHHADFIGNVIALTDAFASLLSTFRYTPFGQLTLCTGTVFPRHLFASKEWEAEIGAAYFGFRHYVPRLERWLTRDPLGEAGGIGLYRHGFANPFLGVDSWGLYFGESVVNGLGTIGEWTWQGVSAVGKGLWTVGEWGVQGAVATGQGALWLGDELLTMGRIMGGNAWGILSGDAFWREKRPHISLEAGQCSVLITVTGIRNEMDEQRNFKNSISGLSPFNSIANPVYIDNPTHYLGIGDAMQILGHEMGLIQEVDQDVAHVINEAAQKLSAQNCCCWRIYVVAHSQGTMIVQRSLSLVESEAKSHLYIVGLGGETSFNAQRDGLAYAHNIANKHDLVPTFARLIVPLEAGDKLDYFEDDNRWLDAHNFQKSYRPYLEHHSGSIVP